VWQKSRTFGGLARASASDEAARNAREEERKIEEGRKGEKGGGEDQEGREEQRVQEGKEGDAANVHGRVSHARTHARTYVLTHTRRGMRCDAERRRHARHLPNRAAPGERVARATRALEILRAFLPAQRGETSCRCMKLPSD